MYLKRNRRLKDGKEHVYWNIVESKRCAGGKIVQRQVLYLGEINDGQLQSWSRVIKAFDEGTQRSTQLALFPADRAVPQHAQSYGVAVRLDAMELHRPRQWGACWLAVTLYEQLGLDRFWAERLPASREGTRWDDVVATLVCYRLIDPGSEWRLHRLWFERSAMADLLGADFGLVEKNALYRCLDKVLEHKAALFAHLRQCWQDLFAARFEVLLYDLTSTYFESAPPASDAAGNTSDKTTLRAFLHKIETQYGKAERIWVMDRGIPTEEVLAEMRAADPPVFYLVGTPKGRLTKLEKALTGLPWQAVREGVDVKLLAQEQELYVFAQSHARIAKERAMRRRKLKWLWARLKQIKAMEINREELLMKLGAARAKARAAWRLLDVEVAPQGATFSYTLNRKKLRDVRRREGRYLLRTNLCGRQPAAMWQFYIQLVEVEAVFKNLKDDLRLRPIYHQLERRIEAHIFVAFMAYCLHVTLRARLKPLAGGLTPRGGLDKFADIPMLDVHSPTTDARTLILSRYTELKADQKILVRQLNLTLPPQPPPRITAAGHIAAAPTPGNVVETF